MRFWTRSLLFSIMRSSVVFYTSPNNFNYWYNFGVLALYFLAVQIISGIFLVMYYNPSVLFAFDSVLYMNNEVFFGWWVRALHANGSSWFFLVIYAHILRGIYYGSFFTPRYLLWFSGVIIYLLMIATAFLGYVLPWGQMSFWAAMVITSLLSSIPLIGSEILGLLWGGFTIYDASLKRFFSLHYFLPFLILILAILHLFFLHEFGSSNPLGIVAVLDFIPLLPYYGLKDFFGILVAWFFFFFSLYYIPDLIIHSDNYIESDPFVTPEHIVPEWYFLYLYAILRSVLNKLLGMVLVIFSVLGLLLLPITSSFCWLRGSRFKLSFLFFFWLFAINWLLLTWIGGMPVVYPFDVLGQFLTLLFFLCLYLFLPISNMLDSLCFHLYYIRHCSWIVKHDGFRISFNNIFFF